MVERIRRVESYKTSALSLVDLIHRSAWKALSPKFGCRILHRSTPVLPAGLAFRHCEAMRRTRDVVVSDKDARACMRSHGSCPERTRSWAGFCQPNPLHRSRGLRRGLHSARLWLTARSEQLAKELNPCASDQPSAISFLLLLIADG